MMRLHDTARRAIVPFEPGPVVDMYVCGITPYDATHLGHAFTYVAHDLIIRRLEDRGHTVRMVRNYTDIDDPLYERARARGLDPVALAQAEIARFESDALALDLRPAMAEPRVSTSIPEIIDLVERLVAGGHAYTVEGTTFFDVATFERFGALSGLEAGQLVELARQRGGTPDDPRQRNPLDFVLWRPSGEGEAWWDSPMGAGRPGWHIECSAMALAHLGEHIDLHGGGQDLVFPHHECEIAQVEALTGRPHVGHWTHVGMVAYQGEKMSKSLGNLVFVSELRERHDPRSIRLAMMAFHYRAGFEWFDPLIDEAERRLGRWLAAARRSHGPDPSSTLERVRAALDDDLDTPTALAALDDLAVADGHSPDSAAGLVRAAALVGIDLARAPVR